MPAAAAALRRRGHAARRADNSQSRNGFGYVGLSWTGARGISAAATATTTRKLRNTRGRRRAGAADAHAATPSRCAAAARTSRARSTPSGPRWRCAATSTTSWRAGKWTPPSPTTRPSSKSCRPIDRSGGSRAAWARRYSIARSTRVGAEALSPAVDAERRGRVPLRRGDLAARDGAVRRPCRARAVRARSARRARSFTTGSGSLGVLLRPAGADDRVTIALSLARAARNPALEELFYFGTHAGQLRLRSRQSRPASRARDRLRRRAPLALAARRRAR